LPKFAISPITPPPLKVHFSPTVASVMLSFKTLLLAKSVALVVNFRDQNNGVIRIFQTSNKQYINGIRQADSEKLIMIDTLGECLLN
jgi:hypothetical protein